MLTFGMVQVCANAILFRNVDMLLEVTVSHHTVFRKERQANPNIFNGPTDQEFLYITG